jgi:predicted ABC-type transport system involved in lysophospholipase L1 biosynthesis ATPase subunit
MDGAHKDGRRRLCAANTAPSTTTVDAATTAETLDLVCRLPREQGRTVVLVLHDLGQARRAYLTL